LWHIDVDLWFVYMCVVGQTEKKNNKTKEVVASPTVRVVVTLGEDFF
jgi:hypothetical protein